MTFLERLFHEHEWAYAEATMPGLIDGKPRPLCFRRVCVKCGWREEIMRYTGTFITVDGTVWMRGPQWVPEVIREPAPPAQQARDSSP